jgi:hypothetical protein
LKGKSKRSEVTNWQSVHRQLVSLFFHLVKMRQTCHQNKQSIRIHHTEKLGSGNQKDSKIRDRYLHALGFGLEATKETSNSKTSSLNDRYQKKILKEPIKLPLLREKEKILDTCEKFFKKPPVAFLQQKPRPLLQENTRPASVSFQSTAVVYSVPSRHCFSNRIKSQLWFESREFTYNTHRNMIEFAFEKNDWRQVLEEDRFFTCSSTGKRIHPVHYIRRLSSHFRSPFHRVVNN